MNETAKKRSSKKGLDPGSLVHIGSVKSAPVHISSIIYHQDMVMENPDTDPKKCSELLSDNHITWLNVDGIHQPQIISELGQQLKIHSLVLEDIMNSMTRPKVEIFDDYLFVTLKTLEVNESHRGLLVEQLSIVIGKNYLVTFQENSQDNFGSIRERIRTAKGKVRTKDAYYLLYLILDTVVDNYIAISEKFAGHINHLETIVLQKPNEQTQARILAFRKELLDFKRSIDPLKEAVNTIMREMDEENAKYYRDLYDHVIYESENLAMYRELVANLLDLYHSNLGIKMNQIMKVLTIITTIFVPLTFIVGVYGMNFENMPELQMKNGYFIVLGVMALLVILMLVYFQRKKWL
ncbi:MAG TPA: magnesium/cobalt transporter CorA [Flavobacteriales bacterium]